MDLHRSRGQGTIIYFIVETFLETELLITFHLHDIQLKFEEEIRCIRCIFKLLDKFRNLSRSQDPSRML